MGGLMLLAPTANALVEPAQQLATCFLTSSDHLYIVAADEVYTIMGEQKATKAIIYMTLAAVIGFCIALLCILSIVGVRVKSYDMEDKLVIGVIVMLILGSGSIVHAGKNELAELKPRLISSQALKNKTPAADLDIINICSDEFGLKNTVVNIVVVDDAIKSRFEVKKLK